MSNFHSLKRNYFKFILRPLRDLKLSLVYFYGRIALSLAMRGIKLPGYFKIKSKMPSGAIEAYERKVLVYEIKGERYFVRKGPLFLRKLTESILVILARNRFWLLMGLKITVAIFAIAIPISIFVILRGVLPVPERVPYEPVKTQLAKKSNFRVDWFYTESPFKETVSVQKEFNYIDPQNARGVSITPVLETHAPPGLMHFGIGYYPTLLTLLRGFLVGNSSSLTVEKQEKNQIEKQPDALNRLRIQYYLFPSKDNESYQCQIQLKDQNGNTLAQSTQETPKKHVPRSPYSLATAWRERFMPNTIPNFGYIGEFVIAQKTVPEKIIATVSDLTTSQQAEPKKTTDNGRNLTNDNCIFVLGDFSYESVTPLPPKRRGIVFILVDTLRADTAYDAKLMPNLNNYAKTEGMKFLEHRAQANMTVPSVMPLMTSHYSRELGPIAFSYAADEKLRKDFYAQKIPLMPTSMGNLGYRVGGIGWLSLFSEALKGGVDLGFHNAIISESEEYEARQITEQMAVWLETYGDAPFFLYVHYNTMHGPYKPPLGNIDLKKFLAKPFGISQRNQFYDGLARYFDEEFLNITQKLKDLGIYDSVDIVITADHGAQMNSEPWKYFSGTDQNIEGGYADKGHSLSDEEVHVPLILHIADNEKMNGVTFSTPTAHVDLFPTLYDLAGGDGLQLNKNNAWRGIDFYPAIKVNGEISLQEKLKERKSIYFDGHKYAGILYWGDEFANKPMKYIRQFESDNVKLYLGHNPWSEYIRWYQPEMFSSVNFLSHTENLLPIVPNETLRKLREKYFSLSPSDKIIKFTAKYSGGFLLKIRLKINDKRSSGSKPVFDNLPESIRFKKSNLGNIVNYSFFGKIKKDEFISINTSSATVLQIDFAKNITPIICANGNSMQSRFLAAALEKNTCTFFSPPDGIIEENYSAYEKPVIVQRSLVSEKAEQVEGTGAGAALQTALREWGYAK